MVLIGFMRPCRLHPVMASGMTRLRDDTGIMPATGQDKGYIGIKQQVSLEH